jgi:hypothetical protein
MHAIKVIAYIMNGVFLVAAAMYGASAILTA